MWSHLHTDCRAHLSGLSVPTLHDQCHIWPLRGQEGDSILQSRSEGRTKGSEQIEEKLEIHGVFNNKYILSSIQFRLVS